MLLRREEVGTNFRGVKSYDANMSKQLLFYIKSAYSVLYLEEMST